jgi:hypothetical protein
MMVTNSWLQMAGHKWLSKGCRQMPQMDTQAGIRHVTINRCRPGVFFGQPFVVIHLWPAICSRLWRAVCGQPFVW